MSIGTNPYALSSSWCNYSDHTPTGSNMLIADGSCYATDRVWSQTVGINPNQLYTFSGWVSSNYNNSPATLKIKINGQDINTTFTVAFSSCSGWSQFSYNWTSGSSETTATIEIFDTNTAGIGNDFNLDDLYFSCPVTTDNMTVYVGSPTISPSGPITRCVHYETGVWLTLTTNLTSNIQWYENGNPISGATSSTLNLNGNPNGGTGYPTCTSTITVKNTSTDCTSTSVQVTRKNFFSPQVYFSPEPYPTPINYCKSTGGIIQQVPSIQSGTVYWWEVKDPFGNPATGVSISPNYSSNPSATITFPSYTYGTAKVIAKATENGCTGAWDGSWVQSYWITVDQGCRNGNLITGRATSESVETSVVKKTTIYPNPANNEVIINSANPIKQVRIYNAAGNLVKQVAPSGAKIVSVEVSNLKPGLYGCKILSEGGVHVLKFIILR